MKYKALREEVYEANLEIYRRGYVVSTWGNVSGIDRASAAIAIKPSGVPYEQLKPTDMVVVDIFGRQMQGELKPSSDLKTHLILYQAFGTIGGIVHTCSRYATAWAQANREIPCYGTCHADYFLGAIPITKPLTRKEVEVDYEIHVGQAVVRRFESLDYRTLPGVLLSQRGPVSWGDSVSSAIFHMKMLEEVAQLAWMTESLANPSRPASQYLIDKHYQRKHGPNSVYGQKPKQPGAHPAAGLTSLRRGRT